jgi:hypothetical protein
VVSILNSDAIKVELELIAAIIADACPVIIKGTRLPDLGPRWRR